VTGPQADAVLVRERCPTRQGGGRGSSRARAEMHVCHVLHPFRRVGVRRREAAPIRLGVVLPRAWAPTASKGSIAPSSGCGHNPFEPSADPFGPYTPMGIEHASWKLNVTWVWPFPVSQPGWPSIGLLDPPSLVMSSTPSPAFRAFGRQRSRAREGRPDTPLFAGLRRTTSAARTRFDDGRTGDAHGARRAADRK
jgi:hypothetical protein